MLGKHSLVTVLLSKWDLVREAGKTDPSLLNFVNETLPRKFTDRFTSHVARITCHQVAAMPDTSLDSDMKPAYGVAEVFQLWVEDAPESRTQGREHPPPRSLSREIDRYTA